MFDRIAPLYDLMNSVMSAGLHHRWRRRAVDLAGLQEGMRALDVATGTGDLAVACKERVGSRGEVVGCDVAGQMLERARGKAPDVRFEQCDALELCYPDDRFDACTVGFGLRNFSDLRRGLEEMARVVRPGGRVVVLEITTPQRPPLAWFFRLWFDRLVPIFGTVAGQASAYRYLPQSVRRFPGPRDLAALMAQVGLCDLRYVVTAGGIIAIHAGTVRGHHGAATASS